jgi:ATP-dependent helicase/nuclease subunit A
VREVPLPPLGKEHKRGPIAAAEEEAKAAAMQEHWRLLYVALTRAEEALFIGGSLSKKEAKRGIVHEDSWYARLEPLFEGEPLADPVWTWRKEWGYRAKPLVPDESATKATAHPPELPRWMMSPIGPEPRPPRPLAPSAAGEDTGAEPPLPPGAAPHAARRGTLIHKLLERLPEVEPKAREEAARRWLARQAGDLDEAIREEMLTAALGVLDHPGFAALFSPAALAEVPLAAMVDGVVVAGIVDRLLIEEGCVTVVDFKTTHRPPARPDEIPLKTLRQMAAYVAALEVIFPGREVRAGVLYTHTPVLFELSAADLLPHRKALHAAQQGLSLPEIA